MSQTVESFHSYMDDVSNLFGLSVGVGLPHVRLEALRRAVEADRELSVLVNNYTNMRKQNILVRMGREDASSDLKGHLSELFFTFMVKGVAHIYSPTSEPLRHHWLPCAYLKAFGNKGRERRIVIRAVDFKGGVPSDSMVDDLSFSHDPVNGVGFYDLSVEHMFSSFESFFMMMSQDKREKQFLSLATAGLFISQVIRNPKFGVFSEGSVENVFGEFVAALDHFDRLYVRGVEISQQAVFSADVPERVFRSVSGQEIYTLPISHKEVFMLSGEPFSHEDAVKQAYRFRRNMVSHAARSDGRVYGVSMKYL